MRDSMQKAATEVETSVANELNKTQDELNKTHDELNKSVEAVTHDKPPEPPKAS
jgi:hypothetical protein